MLAIIRNSADMEARYRGAVVAIGNFDGLHVGHRALLSEAARLAAEYRAPLAVMSFEPHPREFFGNTDGQALRIYSLHSKLALLASLGVQYVFLQRFNAAFAALSAQDFIQTLLVKQLQVRHVITGENFCFGKGRSGDQQVLQHASKTYGFGYTAHHHIMDGNAQPVSSSAVRALLAAGDMPQAAQRLGQPYHISGRVQHGAKRGRELGFPTANIALRRLFLPRFGVYAVRARLSDSSTHWEGVANLGIKPSFGADTPLLEVHLFDAAPSLYGKRLCVELLEHIRDEQRFPSLDALKQQIAQDAEEARKRLRHFIDAPPITPISL